MVDRFFYDLYTKLRVIMQGSPSWGTMMNFLIYSPFPTFIKLALSAALQGPMALQRQGSVKLHRSGEIRLTRLPEVTRPRLLVECVGN